MNESLITVQIFAHIRQSIVFFKIYCFLMVAMMAFPAMVQAGSDLNIEDEIVMSLAVKNSNNPDELRLCLEYFPNSPFAAKFKKRLYLMERKNKSSKNPRTSNHEITMSRMVRRSNDIKQMQLFLKMFPYSPFAGEFREKLGSSLKKETWAPRQELTQKVATKKSEKSIKELEKELDKKTESESPESEKTKTEAKTEAESVSAPEKESPPRDGWSKWEFGLPFKLTIKDSEGSEAKTKGAPIGFVVGWSSDIFFNTGSGFALDYFSTTLDQDGSEFQHLYTEWQIKGFLFNLVNWGVGIGAGYTTMKPATSNPDLKIIPGQGIIQTYSIGIASDHYGINYVIGNFTGACKSLVQTSSMTATETNIKWSGSLSMLTFELVF